jgi:hypothetical protein
LDEKYIITTIEFMESNYMSKEEIVEVEPLDKDDTIIMAFEKVFYSNTSTYTHVFFSKSAIMIVLNISIGFPGLDPTKDPKRKKEMQYPKAMSEIFKKIENPTYFQKKEIAKIKLKKSKLVATVTIELQPGKGLYGKKKRQGATLSFLKRDYDNVYFVLNNNFKDKLVLISKKSR